MAIGDKNDFANRLKMVLPTWFGDNYPILNALLNGYADLESFIYSLVQYVKLQMRIQTATDENLDLIACDFFGDLLERFPGVSDTLFRKEILATLLEEMATRQGMIKAIKNLTGHDPIIFEPWNYNDTGAYNVNVWGYNSGGAYGGYAPYNFWINVFVSGSPMDKYGGLNSDTWGYNSTDNGANGAYGNPALNDGTLTYDQVLAVINRVKVGGTVPHLTLIYL